MKTQAKFNELKEALNGLSILEKYGVNVEDFDTLNELRNELEELIQQDEVIYYHNAMKYLSENDPSLTESMEIAKEFGYTTDKLNSEFLATILKQKKQFELLKETLDIWSKQFELYFELKNKIE
jgi:hypothetical protein